MSEERVIDGFLGDHAFLGSFHPCRVELDGLVYPSAEAAYQACKSGAPLQRRMFTQMLPSAARRLGHAQSLRPGWADVRVDEMRRVLRAKFADPALRDRLLATGEARLVNTVTWDEPFWGVRAGVGENMLGQLLEQLRAELLEQATAPAADTSLGDTTPPGDTSLEDTTTPSGNTPSAPLVAQDAPDDGARDHGRGGRKRGKGRGKGSEQGGDAPVELDEVTEPDVSTESDATEPDTPELAEGTPPTVDAAPAEGAGA